jgi:hypothetical protein
MKEVYDIRVEITGMGEIGRNQIEQTNRYPECGIRRRYRLILEIPGRIYNSRYFPQ